MLFTDVPDMYVWLFKTNTGISCNPVKTINGKLTISYLRHAALFLASVPTYTRTANHREGVYVVSHAGISVSWTSLKVL